MQNHAEEYKKELERASDAGSIPPPINPEVTSEILKSKTCICGRHIGEQEESFIQKQHNDYEDKDELRFLTDGILTFANQENKIKDIKYAMLDAMDEIHEATEKKKELQEELSKINETLTEIDESKLHDNPEARRTKLENKISNLDILIGGAGNSKRDIQERLAQVEKDLKKNISEDQSTNELERKREITERLHKKLAEIKNVMESSIREKLEKSVWSTFD